ncbi:MAG: MATE family efflux transporter [Bacteroidales bacterium]|nr:MATE family efflux transporter [Bacteroidales bacterium]
MQIQLSNHFTYRRLLKFTLPSILMMIVSSIYGVVDGVMVSNFVGTTAFASLNLIWPYIAIVGSLGFMFGTGGAALVAKVLGMKEVGRARRLFSMLTYVTLALGILMGAVGYFTIESIVRMLGAEGDMVNLSIRYGSILFIAQPFYMLQIFFQSMMVVAEKPRMGMWITVGAGVMNGILDFLFIAVFKWGLNGAALATAASEMVGGMVPMCYFLFNRKNQLSLCRCSLDLKALGKACFNGLSEFVMQIAISVVSMLYMWQLMRHAGESGVAAYGVMMYFAFVFVAVYIGYGVGSAPIMSYNYGAENHREMKNVLLKSLQIIMGFGLCIELLAQLLAHPLCAFFVGYDAELLQMTIRAFRIYAIMFLYTGFNIYMSSFFTALNNGPVSAFLSLLRTLVLESGAVLLLPFLFGIDGIWFSVAVAEFVALVVSFALLKHYQKRYGY